MAATQLKNGKVAGSDGISPEIWKHGGPPLIKKVYELFICCWEQDELPNAPCAKTEVKNLTSRTTML